MTYLEGTVKSGLNKAEEFIQKEIYLKQYKEKLGFIPYPGTLNVKLQNNIKLDIQDRKTYNLKKINGKDNLGDVFFLFASISNKDNSITKQGAVLFPVRSIYSTDTIEFVSEDNLRETMKLKDNDTVVINIRCRNLK